MLQSLSDVTTVDDYIRLDGSLATSGQKRADHDLLNPYFSNVFTHENLSNIVGYPMHSWIISMFLISWFVE